MSLAETFNRRVQALRGGLNESGLVAAIVSWGPHVRYLSGIVSGGAPVFLIVDPEYVTAVVPASAGIDQSWNIEIQPYFDGTIDEIVSSRHNALVQVARVVNDRGFPLDQLGGEKGNLHLSDLAAFPALEHAVDIGPLLARQRRRKDAQEIAHIRANLLVLETGFEAARATIRPGVSELEVWAALHTAMMARIGSAFPLEGNFASGPRTLEDEPQPTNRCLEAGDLIFIDLYPIIDGYAADLTRVFVAGRPTETQRARHAVLEEALAAGEAALKPGVRACDVDQAVRASVSAALGGYTFSHHAGHALGLEGQERPMLIPGDDMVIEPGMVIAIEPGAYLPDMGGMRIERNYLVTETGSESLSDYPIELFACG